VVTGKLVEVRVLSAAPRFAPKRATRGTAARRGFAVERVRRSSKSEDGLVVTKCGTST
jgi:hypothetical protein